jgi:hypothetical protein
MGLKDNGRREVHGKALFSILLSLVAMLVPAVPALTLTNNGVVSWWRLDEGSGDVAMEALAARMTLF